MASSEDSLFLLFRDQTKFWELKRAKRKPGTRLGCQKFWYETIVQISLKKSWNSTVAVTAKVATFIERSPNAGDLLKRLHMDYLTLSLQEISVVGTIVYPILQIRKQELNNSPKVLYLVRDSLITWLCSEIRQEKKIMEWLGSPVFHKWPYRIVDIKYDITGHDQADGLWTLVLPLNVCVTSDKLLSLWVDSLICKV